MKKFIGLIMRKYLLMGTRRQGQNLLKTKQRRDIGNLYRLRSVAIRQIGSNPSNRINLIRVVGFLSKTTQAGIREIFANQQRRAFPSHAEFTLKQNWKRYNSIRNLPDQFTYSRYLYRAKPNNIKVLITQVPISVASYKNRKKLKNIYFLNNRIYFVFVS